MALESLDLATYLGIPIYFIVVISIWSIIWKGIALWTSARKTQKIWFVVLLIVNTVGILEILYIFIFSKMGLKSKAKSARPKKSRAKPTVKLKAMNQTAKLPIKPTAKK